MTTDLPSIAARLDDLETRYGAFEARPRKEQLTRVEFNPYPDGSDGWNRRQQELQERDEYEQTKEGFQHELDALLLDLSTIYLDGDNEFREGIRKLIANRKTVRMHAWGWGASQADRIKDADDIQWLRLGLAAISIENCQLDWRDTSIALQGLWTAAERAGIDPRPHFDEVGEMSSDEPSPAALSSMKQKMKGWR